LRVLQAIRAGIDDGQPIHVILDNLNHHKNRGVREWCAAHGVELVFTPTYGSWANPIETHFGPLRQFVIANSEPRSPSVGPRDPRLPALAQHPHPRPAHNDDGDTPNRLPPHNARTYAVTELAALGQRGSGESADRQNCRSVLALAHMTQLQRTKGGV